MRRVISKKRLQEFWRRRPDAKQPLETWYRVALKADWGSLHDIRRQLPSADGVKVHSGRTLIVFNIGGNKYRLIADVLYPVRVIYVCTVLTHREYDKSRWEEML